jgi:HK97 family phage portal protein
MFGTSQQSSSGVAVTEEAMTAISAAFTANSIIADCMAVMPAKVYRRKGDAREHDTDHPAHRLMNVTPDEGQTTSHMLRATSQGHIGFRGNAVWELLFNRRGQAVQAYGLDPRLIDYKKINGRKLYCLHDDDGRKEFLADEVVHVPWYTPDGFEGKNPVEFMRESMGLTIATNRFPSRFYKNDAKPGGILKKKTRMSSKQRNEVREEWMAIHGGVDGAGKMAILSGGLEWQDVGLAPKDADFLASRKHQAEEVARWYRVPPHMLGILDKATYDNVENLNIFFLLYTLFPWIKKWESELNMKLFTRREQNKYYIEYDFKTFLRADTKSQIELIEKQIRNGIVTLDEVRKMDNRPAYEDGIGAKPLVMGSQLATLESVIESGGLPNVAGLNGPNTDQPDNKDPMTAVMASLHLLTGQQKDTVCDILDAMRGKSKRQIDEQGKE